MSFTIAYSQIFLNTHFKTSILFICKVYVEETLSVAKRRISSTKWIADSLGKFKKQPDHDKTFFFEM